MRAHRLTGLAVRTCAVVAGTLAAGVGLTAPAVAHPLGLPQTVHLEARGSQVLLRWAAAPDDLTALGLHVGALGAPRRFVYDQGVLVPEESDPGDIEVLAGSPAFEAYLLDRLQVSQQGRPCRGTVRSTADLATTGVRLRFTCPDPVDRVRVAVATLTDVDPAYRTAASSEAGDRALYSSSRTSHTWDFAAGVGDRSPARASLWLGPLIGACAVAAGAAAVVRPRLRPQPPA